MYCSSMLTLASAGACLATLKLSETAALGCGPQPGQAPSTIAITKPTAPSNESQGVRRSVKRSVRVVGVKCWSIEGVSLGAKSPRAGRCSTDFGASRSRSERRGGLKKLGETERGPGFGSHESHDVLVQARSVNKSDDDYFPCDLAS